MKNKPTCENKNKKYSVSAYNYDTVPKHVRKHSVRTILVGLGFVGMFLAVGGKAWYHQMYNSNFLVDEGEKRYLYTQKEKASRGSIKDADGNLLAIDIQSFSLWVNPSAVIDIITDNNIRDLSKILGVSVREIKVNLEKNKHKHFMFLKRNVSMDNYEKVKALKLDFINADKEFTRSYPSGNAFSNVLGFTGIDGHGLSGAELQLENLLKGSDGQRTVVRNRLGQVIDEVVSEDTMPVKNGEDITLTIKSKYQVIVANNLAEAIKKHGASSGAAVVVEAKTGNIVAMVSLPNYDNNEVSQRKGAALKQKSVVDSFEPGSIIKPLVMALALDAKAVKVNEQINVGNGVLVYNGKKITDVSKNGGLMTPEKIIAKSSNVGMSIISERLTAEQMHAVFSALGFGRVPDIKFPGITTGRLRPYKKWRPIEKITQSYGYGLSVSLLQMAKAYTAFANNGYVKNLNMIKNEAIEKSNETYGLPVYTDGVVKSVVDMMVKAQSNTGSKLQKQILPFKLAGKSGTSRMLVNKKYSTENYRASFIGLAPASDIKYVMAVTIENPTKNGYFGTLVSGPVVAKSLNEILTLENERPDNEEYFQMLEKYLPSPEQQQE